LPKSPVPIRVHSWFTNSHKEAQEAQRKNHFAPNHFAKKIRTHSRPSAVKKISHKRAQKTQRKNILHQIILLKN
jgi:hypothetical protein